MRSNEVGREGGRKEGGGGGGGEGGREGGRVQKFEVHVDGLNEIDQI